ncbi:MAG: cupin domain-containing protein, partial [Thermomicrobiales bacterium]
MAMVTVLNDGEGEVFGGDAYHLRFLAQSPEHPIAITENAVPPGFPGPVRHRHEQMTDIFYVLAGTMKLHIGDERQVLGPGGFALVPPGVVHTFSNDGDAPVRFLNIFQPSGNEHYLKEVGRRVAAGSPPSRAQMAEIASRYDFVPE